MTGAVAKAAQHAKPPSARDAILVNTMWKAIFPTMDHGLSKYKTNEFVSKMIRLQKPNITPLFTFCPFFGLWCSLAFCFFGGLGSRICFRLRSIIVISPALGRLGLLLRLQDGPERSPQHGMAPKRHV